jgi:hypothetical protein
MFGGRTTSGHLADTFEWDGNDWIARPTVIQPAARFGHAMAHDTARQRTVLFGGQLAGWPYLNAETWEWDGATWTQRSSAVSPLARIAAGLAFDPVRNRMVLAGGTNTIFQPYGDTWEWNGTSWTQIIAGGWWPPSHLVWAPSTPFGPRIAGPGLDFGNGNMRAYDGVSWGAWEPSGPALLYMPKYAYDSARDQVVAFGSNGGVAMTTVLGGTPWSATQVGAGCGNPPVQLLAVPTAGPILGATGRALVLNAPTPAFVVTIGFGMTSIGPYGLPLPLDAFGMPGCVLRHSAEIPFLPVFPVAGGLEFALAIPAQMDLIGRTLLMQAYGYAPGQNAAEIVFSNRLDWRIGDV